MLSNFSEYRYVWFLLPDTTVQIYSFICLFLTSSNIAGFLRFCPALKNICLVPFIKRMSCHRCSIPPHVYCCADKKRWYGYETISSVPCYIWTISHNYYIVFYFSKLAVFSCFLRPFYIIRNSQFFIFKNASAFLLRNAHHAMHDIFFCASHIWYNSPDFKMYVVI